MNNLLEVVGLTKRYGGIAALDDCRFGVAEGSITGLIGPNGSGKTTAFNVISGYVRPDAGSVRFAGRKVRPEPAKMCRAGLVRTFQHPRVFGTLTALENVVVAAAPPWWATLTPRVRRRDRDRALALMEEFGLAGVAHQPAGQLSHGQRKLLAFAAALMSEPRMVLLDEPSAGVSPAVAEVMERHIKSSHAAGVTFLVVEHNLSFVMRLCDPLIVMARGRPIVIGPPAVVQADPGVLDTYLGAWR
ncbi:MAG TPA: ABC transporter ATP-binding protein [Streptosporangiaceae bacterium]|nr:ABC transporter ATP-binding protein [Streptosporangiaceae bacterium]